MQDQASAAVEWGGQGWQWGRTVARKTLLDDFDFTPCQRRLRVEPHL